MTEMAQQLLAAMNAHDARALAAYFNVDYRSEHPTHPDRGFTGRDQVLENWTAVFEGVPDFTAVLVASARTGDALWLELRWQGTHHDATPFLMAGVIVLGVSDGTIAWARLYMEPVARNGGTIQRAVRELYK